MAAVTTLAGNASSAPADGGKAATGKADAGTAFAAMIAGAATPAAALPSKSPSADKPQRAKRDDDSPRDGDADPTATKAVGVGGAIPALVILTPVASIAPTTTAPAPTPTKTGKADTQRAASPSVVASPPTNGADAKVDLTQTAIDATDPKLAPVLAALADSLAAKQASDLPAAPATSNPVPPADTAIATVATPGTATASLMASRIPTKGEPFSGRADARVSTSSRKTADDADPDTSNATPDATMPVGATPIAASTGTTAAPTTHAPIANGVAGQLASGAADRQLDLAKQGAWLDGISHDIAATAAGSGPLRFEVAPQHLGAVQVEMTRGGDGATVTLTASSEAGRAALADARPQLIADARAQGIHIASAQVDVGSGQTGTDSRQASSGQSDSRPSSHSASGDGGFSAQANAQGDSGRQSQTRSQPLAINHARMAGTTDAANDTESAAPEPTDGLYA